MQNILFREDNNFLEGFYYDTDRKAFYESSGLTGKSYVHKLDYAVETTTLSINEAKMSKLPSKYFGEGLAPRSASEFVVLTYKHKKIFTIDRDTMQFNS